MITLENKKGLIEKVEKTEEPQIIIDEVKFVIRCNCGSFIEGVIGKGVKDPITYCVKCDRVYDINLKPTYKIIKRKGTSKDFTKIVRHGHQRVLEKTMERKY